MATLITSGTSTFSVNDILRIKNSIDDEWMRVDAVIDNSHYTVTRDLSEDYALNNNPAWSAGAAIVNYGQSGDGGIFLTASESNSPYISIFDHAGSPWDTINTRVRLGNLNGYLGYSSDIYGLGIGSSAANQANLTFDSTNGIRIRTATTDKFVFDNSGNAYIASSVTIGGSSGVLASTLDGWKHASDTTKIDGGDIYADTVTATQINVSELSAISADLGTVTAGTITGVTLQTAASGQRVVIDGNENTLVFYDSINQEIVSLNDDVNALGDPGMKILNGHFYTTANTGANTGYVDIYGGSIYVHDSDGTTNSLTILRSVAAETSNSLIRLVDYSGLQD